ncbi:CDP-glycerol glycerophosphotransferase family protein [Peribacillus asahii]|uniref:CDP-glycerol glycerophosphotransferase family protein n=1 Tax=Peribacillus asahii TaxID=228899 RepID=UPI00207AE231|nr:CDP-glycerol glycerophosphotransferase family protein [Peribacillus asahii]USK72293.1 CDP-glycerol glycerophosphotransferase family protein [Peribacillus asahii]
MLTHITNESSERIRLRSNFTELEFQFFLKDGKMLAPFTTNKGNVSFKLQFPGFITKVEQIEFFNKDNIEIKGYVVHPLWLKRPANIQKKLVFATKDDEYVFKVPLKVVDGDDLSKVYRHGDGNSPPIGYEAVIPIKALLLNKSGAITLKARIELSYSEGNRKVTTETSPIKFKSPDFKKKSLVKKVNGKKKLIFLSRTKKAGQLNIHISEYDFKNDIKVKIKGGIFSVKRHSIVKRLYRKVFYWLGRLPANKKIVVFESFQGKQFSDNPRAIYEYLQANHYPYKLYWSVDKKYLHHFQDKNLNCIRRFSMKWLFIMPRTRFWVTNSRMPLWLPKPKNTIYVQTWHGTPLKRLAADMNEVYIPGTTAENYKKNFIREAKNWDYLISPNAYSTEIFRRAFQFDKEVSETGYPRNDFICNYNNKGSIEKLVADYGIPLHKKIILYAPTWRDNQFYAKGKYRFDINLDLDLMKEKLGEDYVILFRLHYLVSENLDLTPYEGFAYDFSNYEDIRELYVMADILITDYSSVFFDYSNLKRPMIFYVYDIDQYRDNLRGFYFDFEQEAPGPLVKTTEEVIQTIKKIEADGFQLSTKFDSFHEKFCYLECGDSTRKVVEKIFLN